MPKRLDLISTIKGSLLGDFYPRGWDMRKMDRCAAMTREQLLKPGRWWNKDFKPVVVRDVADMDRRMGDAIADQIEQTRGRNQQLILILPVGPMGMYKQVVNRIKSSRTPCDHVTTFNMDEWADSKGNSMPGDQPGGFEHAMTRALFGPLGKHTVPRGQRNFATRNNLPTYPQKVNALRGRG